MREWGASLMAAPVLICLALLTGLGIVWPLLPFVAMDLGATPEQVTYLLATDTLAIFFAAPLWGRMSDRIGRRRAAIAALAISPFAYLLLAEANSLELLFLSRAVSGASIAVIPVLQAYITERSSPKDRVSMMAGINGTYGLAFVIGPAISVLALSGDGGSYRLPAYIGMACGATAVLLAAAMLKECAGGTEEASHGHLTQQWTLPSRGLRSTVVRAVGIFAVLAFAYAALVATIGIWSAETLSWGAEELSVAFVVCGLAAFVSQFGLVGLIAPRLGETRLAGLAIASVVAGFLTLSFLPSDAGALVAMALAGAGVATANSCLQSLVSKAAPVARRGSVLGFTQTAASLARVLGPVWGGFCMTRFGLASPYVAGAVLLIAAGVMLQFVEGPRVAACQDQT